MDGKDIPGSGAIGVAQQLKQNIGKPQYIIRICIMNFLISLEQSVQSNSIRHREGKISLSCP